MKNLGVMLLVLLFGLCGSLFLSYNGLVQKDEAVANAWADVDSTLQRRADLIPNLVSTVKGYAQHERETLDSVVEARTRATQTKLPVEALSDPAAMQKFQEAQGALSSALSRLVAIAEDYPDLKANQNFLELQNQLEGTENRINVARERYNKVVRLLNASLRAVPGKFINDFFLHLEPREYFKAEEKAREVPKVEF